MHSLHYTLADEPAETPPACPGVYRFLDQYDQVLYVGKSINMRNRVRSHFAESSQTKRQRRLLHATRRIDCEPTAGEASALLLENAAIKQQMPTFNRRQRAVRRMWSIVLEPDDSGSVRPVLSCFTLDNPDIRSAYGYYASRFAARRALDTLARAEALCPIMLGLESGKGPCFQRQIGRCRGVCEGSESLADHGARLQQALASRQLSAWPSTEPLVLHERAVEPLACQPVEQWHLLHNWMYLGAYSSLEAARCERQDNTFMFDRDTHRILRGILRQGDLALYRLDSAEAVVWPEG